MTRRERIDDSIRFLSDVADCVERSKEFYSDSDSRCDRLSTH